MFYLVLPSFLASRIHNLHAFLFHLVYLYPPTLYQTMNMNHPVAATESTVHIIPEETQSNLSVARPSCKRRLSASAHQPSSMTSLFDESASQLKELCQNVVKREAAAVRCQLIDALEQQEQSEGQHLVKRRRISTSEEEGIVHTQAHSQDEQQDSSNPVSEQEKAVRQRAARMLRMASLVRNYQATMAQFRRDMLALEQEEGFIM